MENEIKIAEAKVGVIKNMSEDAIIVEITGYREVHYDEEALMKRAREACKEDGLSEEYAVYRVLGFKEGRAEERKRLILKMRRFGMSEEDINTIMSMD